MALLRLTNLRWMVLLGAAVLLHGQGIGVDQLQWGPVLEHDHVAFNYHIPIRDDPFPHQVKEGYAFDGADLGMTVRWHWNGAALETEIQASPASRLHFAYDQDTDFKPTTNFTHGDEGDAHSRSVRLMQSVPLLPRQGLRGELAYLRQWTRYGEVTTFDLNSNPALPSNTFQRVIDERAILYEVRAGVAWAWAWKPGKWRFSAKASGVPLASIYLHNYVPELAATSALAYGAALELSGQRHLGAWQAEFRAGAGQYHGYRTIEGFERQQFWVECALAPPKFW